MKAEALQNLFAMIRSGRDRQHRTPASEQNRLMSERSPGRNHGEVWRPWDRRFLSQKRLNEIRHRTDVNNSIRNRNV